MNKNLITISLFAFVFFLALNFLEVKQVRAIVPGGAINASIFTYCTCGPGYLALFTGYGSTPSGLYYFGPQTQYWVGSGFPVANNIIWYTQNAGICLMNAGSGCYSITGNLVNWYGGSS